MPRKLPIAILPVAIAALFPGECLLAAPGGERGARRCRRDGLRPGG
ncbi:MAG TPA: hypothetical protein VGR67_02490 [Candidatus Polarisedimenticolia bacterium]|jgi:hypothetical protein|nr:hypothetical protein [Candidatus Polarisedimenticolia bacterium]